MRELWMDSIRKSRQVVARVETRGLAYSSPAWEMIHEPSTAMRENDAEDGESTTSWR